VKFGTLLKPAIPLTPTVRPVYAVRNPERTGLIGPTLRSDRFAVQESSLCMGFQFRSVQDVFLVSHKGRPLRRIYMNGHDRLRTTIAQSNLLSLTFSLLSLLQTLDASHILISTTRDGILRLVD
jgi:hypothetical protein